MQKVCIQCGVLWKACSERSSRKGNVGRESRMTTEHGAFSVLHTLQQVGLHSPTLQVGKLSPRERQDNVLNMLLG